MTNKQKQDSRRDFLPVQENLQIHLRAILEWVPYYQTAPRNQADPRSTYMPTVTCRVDQLLFDATVSAAPGQPPRYHFSVAAPLALSSAAMALTATEEFMPEMPLDQSLTVREGSGDTASHSFVDYRYLRQAQDGVRVLRRTDDARRYPVGDSLFALALQMIALHEEGHYLNGHLETSLGFRAVGTHSERHELSPAPSADDLLTSRALELDADHFATITMLAPLCSVVIGDFQRASEYVSDMKCELGKTPLGYMRFLASASMVLGMILWQAEGGLAGPPADRRTHPTPLCRIVHFAHTVSRIVSMVAQNNHEVQAWNEAVNRDTTAIINLFGLKGFFDFRPEADTPWVKEWRQTRQRLMQLKPSMSEAATRAREAVGIDLNRGLPGDLVDFLTLE
jgi:hypothetical protein